jgi:selT/selW/selH-like putative selenoprotein
LEDELKSKYEDIDITLIEGSSGVFDVHLDTELIFSKKIKKRFPSKGEIIDLINEK